MTNPNDPHNSGRYWHQLDNLDVGVNCIRCRTGAAIPKGEAEAVVHQSLGYLEPYECPDGLGWHVRVADPGPKFGGDPGS